MKLKQWLKHLGDGVCEIECDKCGRPFYYDTQCKHNNGMVVCPGCGNVHRLKDVGGIYFLAVEYLCGTGCKNWQCGNCGCEFIFHDGETEETIECPNCHHRKQGNNFIENVRAAWSPDNEANTREEQK